MFHVCLICFQYTITMTPLTNTCPWQIFKFFVYSHTKKPDLNCVDTKNVVKIIIYNFLRWKCEIRCQEACNCKELMRIFMRWLWLRIKRYLNKKQQISIRDALPHLLTCEDLICAIMSRIWFKQRCLDVFIFLLVSLKQ